MKTIPFDVEKWKAGAVPVTRDEVPVTQEMRDGKWVAIPTPEVES